MRRAGSRCSFCPSLCSSSRLKPAVYIHQALNFFLFFLFLGRGFNYRPSSAARPPKNTGLPLAGPDQARSPRLSPSRSTACRRDPRRRRAQHPAAGRRRQTYWLLASLTFFFWEGPRLPLPLQATGSEAAHAPAKKTRGPCSVFFLFWGDTQQAKQEREHISASPPGGGRGSACPKPRPKSLRRNRDRKATTLRCLRAPAPAAPAHCVRPSSPAVLPSTEVWGGCNLPSPRAPHLSQRPPSPLQSVQPRRKLSSWGAYRMC
jgi:hypothetical protein